MMVDRTPLETVRAHYEAIRHHDRTALDRMIEEGETVVVLGHQHVRVRAAGRELSTDWIPVHTVRQGRHLPLS